MLRGGGRTGLTHIGLVGDSIRKEQADNNERLKAGPVCSSKLYTEYSRRETWGNSSRDKYLADSAAARARSARRKGCVPVPKDDIQNDEFIIRDGSPSSSIPGRDDLDSERGTSIRGGIDGVDEEDEELLEELREEDEYLARQEEERRNSSRLRVKSANLAGRQKKNLPYANYMEGGGRPPDRKRASSARAFTQVAPPPPKPEVEPVEKRSSYSIKYFGVAHGQLGVLTRRKTPFTMQLEERDDGGPRPQVVRPMRAGSARSPQRSEMLRPASGRSDMGGHGGRDGSSRVYQGAPLPRARPASAAPGLGLGASSKDGAIYGGVTSTSQAGGGGGMSSPSSPDGAGAGTPGSPPTSPARSSASFRLDPQYKFTGGGAEGAGNGGGGGHPQESEVVAVADFDIVNAVEDYSGSVWLPTNAISGKGLRQMRRREAWQHERYLQRGDTLGPPSGYIAHTALMGWKLSPGYSQPRYSPGTARANASHIQMRAQSARLYRKGPPYFGEV